MSAREEVLARIRAALGSSPVAPAIPRDYRRASEWPDLLELFTHRLADYKAAVVRTESDRVEEAIASTAGARVLIPPALPWAVPRSTVDAAFKPTELDGFDTVVTACTAACAETGTIVLDGSPGQGRRAISLIPDRHVCVVRAAQVVGTVPELLARLDPGRPLTFVSGPSATSDIELERVEGVHGPRTMIVIITE